MGQVLQGLCEGARLDGLQNRGGEGQGRLSCHRQADGKAQGEGERQAHNAGQESVHCHRPLRHGQAACTHCSQPPDDGRADAGYAQVQGACEDGCGHHRRAVRMGEGRRTDKPSDGAHTRCCDEGAEGDGHMGHRDVLCRNAEKRLRGGTDLRQSGCVPRLLHRRETVRPRRQLFQHRHVQGIGQEVRAWTRFDGVKAVWNLAKATFRDGRDTDGKL